MSIPFLLDDKSTVVPVHLAGEQSGGKRKVVLWRRSVELKANGAFRGKSYFKIEPMVVTIARKTGGRPVRIAQSIAESLLTIRRHSAKCRIKTGVKRDGSIVAREAEVVMDTGAYADNRPRSRKRAAYRILGPYRIKHCKIEQATGVKNT